MNLKCKRQSCCQDLLLVLFCGSLLSNGSTCFSEMHHSPWVFKGEGDEKNNYLKDRLFADGVVFVHRCIIINLSAFHYQSFSGLDLIQMTN